MTNLELLKSCIESESLGSDGFRVIVPTLLYKEFVKLDTGLSAKNLGRYPSVMGGEDDQTHLWVENSNVRKYLSRVRK